MDQSPRLPEEDPNVNLLVLVDQVESGHMPSELSLVPSQSASRRVRKSSGSAELSLSSGPIQVTSKDFPLPVRVPTVDDSIGNNTSVACPSSPGSPPLIGNFVNNVRYGQHPEGNGNYLEFGDDFSSSYVFPEYRLPCDAMDRSGGETYLVEDASYPATYDPSDAFDRLEGGIGTSYHQHTKSLTPLSSGEDMQYTCMNDYLAPLGGELVASYTVEAGSNICGFVDDDTFLDEGFPDRNDLPLDEGYSGGSHLVDYTPFEQQREEAVLDSASDYISSVIPPDDVFSEICRRPRSAGSPDMDWIEDVCGRTDSAHMEEHAAPSIPSPFTNGKTLLHGTADIWSDSQGTLLADNAKSRFQTVSDMEKYVAKQLRGHWRPQKF